MNEIDKFEPEITKMSKAIGKIHQAYATYKSKKPSASIREYVLDQLVGGLSLGPGGSHSFIAEIGRAAYTNREKPSSETKETITQSSKLNQLADNLDKAIREFDNYLNNTKIDRSPVTVIAHLRGIDELRLGTGNHSEDALKNSGRAFPTLQAVCKHKFPASPKVYIFHEESTGRRYKCSLIED